MAHPRFPRPPTRRATRKRAAALRGRRRGPFERRAVTRRRGQPSTLPSPRRRLGPASPFFDARTAALGDAPRRRRRRRVALATIRRDGRAAREARPALGACVAAASAGQPTARVDVRALLRRARGARATSRRSPTRSSRCRGSARYPIAPRRSDAQRARSCRGGLAGERIGGVRASPSPRRAATSARCARPRAATATTGSSTARRRFISNVGIARPLRRLRERRSAPRARRASARSSSRRRAGLSTEPIADARRSPARPHRRCSAAACPTTRSSARWATGFELALGTLDVFRISRRRGGGRHGARARSTRRSRT